MAYVLSNDTAAWLDRQRRTLSSQSTPRRGWVFDGGIDGVGVCRITGGNALTGYTGRVYPSMADLRDDSLGEHGQPATVFPCEIGLDSALPAGTVVIVHSIECQVTGGSENTHEEE